MSRAGVLFVGAMLAGAVGGEFVAEGINSATPADVANAQDHMINAADAYARLSTPGSCESGELQAALTQGLAAPGDAHVLPADSVNKELLRVCGGEDYSHIASSAIDGIMAIRKAKSHFDDEVDHMTLDSKERAMYILAGAVAAGAVTYVAAFRLNEWRRRGPGTGW